MNEERQEIYKILELGTDEKNLHKHKNTGGLLYIDLSMIKFSNLSTYIRKQDKEIERLNKELENLKKLNNANYQSFIEVNNIINKLEEILDEDVELRYVHNVKRQSNKTLTEGGLLYRDYIKSKLQELKGSDKE